MLHIITESDSLQLSQGDPLECYRLWARSDASDTRLLLVQFTLTAYWLDDRPAVALTALYLKREKSLSVAVTDQALVSDGSAACEQYRRWSQEHGFVRHVCGEPVGLAALAIPKPWGREIWYTGVEERGVCCFFNRDGATPIPWLQAVIPGEELGQAGRPLVLLKILDPVPNPVTGDLYFELHEEKREVYVVTSVDRSAWPDGTGYIRMGFAAEKMVAYGDDPSAFRQAYLAAVRSYEVVRRQIDALPASRPAGEDLVGREQQLRLEMDSFSNLRPLRTGDVVKVPLLTPHSLQHGVRTVEFQTPVYERKILSFAQRVLTQDHWDTDEAVALMQLEPAPEESFETLLCEEGVVAERIVDFSDFEVRRVRLSGSGAFEFAAQQRYAVIMVVEGGLVVGGEKYSAEQALVLPVGWGGQLIAAEPSSSVVFLLALPRD